MADANVHLAAGRLQQDNVCQTPPTMTGPREGRFNPRKLVRKTRYHLRPAAEFSDSVDDVNPVDIDFRANPWWGSRYSCWEVKGQVAEEYMSLGPRIYDELRQSCRESSSEVILYPYMVGKSPKYARPVLVIASEDEPSRQEAKAAIVKSDILKEYPHFKLWPLRYLPTGPINPVAMRDLAPDLPQPSTTPFEVYYDPDKRIRSIGMRIYIKHGESAMRRATANAMYNGTEYGYLTAAHALKAADTWATPAGESQNQFHFPFGSDGESDGSDDFEVETTSGYSGTSPKPTDRSSASATSSRHSDTSRQSGSCHTEHNTRPAFESPPGSQIRYSDEKNRNENSSTPNLELLGVVSASYVQLDCAVVRVTNETILSFLRGLENVEHNSEDNVRVSSARRASVVALTSHGPVQGELFDLPLYTRFAGSQTFQPVYKFTYEGDILMGDCGSLLINTETKEVYGHVIADSQSCCVAFTVSAEPVFDALKRDGKWQLLALDSDTKLQASRETWEDHSFWDSELDLDDPIFEWDIGSTTSTNISSLPEFPTPVHPHPPSPPTLPDSGRFVLPSENKLHPKPTTSYYNHLSLGQAVKQARNSEGGVDQRLARYLEQKLTEVYGRLQARPDTYILPPDEFALISYYGSRFGSSELIRSAIRRFWDNHRSTR